MPLRLDTAEFSRGVLAELARQLDSSLRRAAILVKATLPAFVEQALTVSPEYQSLLGGRLQAELGVPRPEVVVRSIVQAVASAAEVVAVPVAVRGDSLSGGLRVSLLRVGLSEVLGAADGSLVSAAGFTVPWLEWLLTGGDEVLVFDYQFVPGDFVGSRTGLGVMHRGGGWRVPPEFAGVVTDNWLTRALNAAAPALQSLLTAALRDAG